MSVAQQPASSSTVKRIWQEDSIPSFLLGQVNTQYIITVKTGTHIHHECPLNMHVAIRAAGDTRARILDI